MTKSKWTYLTGLFGFALALTLVAQGPAWARNAGFDRELERQLSLTDGMDTAMRPDEAYELEGKKAKLDRELSQELAITDGVARPTEEQQTRVAIAERAGEAAPVAIEPELDEQLIESDGSATPFERE